MEEIRKIGLRMNLAESPLSEERSLLLSMENCKVESCLSGAVAREMSEIDISIERAFGLKACSFEVALEQKIPVPLDLFLRR